MRDVLTDLHRHRDRGERFALATVVATRRTAPRPLGSKLVVDENGALAGSVSGGCVEGDVHGHAMAVLAGERPHLVSYGIDDDLAFSVGLSCGGEIDVFVQEPPAALVDRAIRAIEDQERAVLFTVVDGPGAGRVCLVTEAGEEAGEGAERVRGLVDGLLRGARPTLLELDGDKVFAEVYAPPPRLVVVGAVDTGEALCRAARGLGWRTIVVDARAAFATPERMPSADEIVVGWPAEALDEIAPDHQTAVVVLSHDEKFDVPALLGALRTEAFYIGAIGARRTQERRRARLLEAGAEAASLERIAGPCGLDVGADTPAETAVSILAEVLAVRAGRGGGRLQEVKGSIHAAAPAPDPAAASS
jgi:xanthine dehydrogenase accessory factor